MDQVLVIIPARYEAKRFPGKMLADIGGKTLIERVVERVNQVSFDARVVVATDDIRIHDHLRSRDIEVVMTRKEHESGTDRCAEVASMMPAYTSIINVQGDEPLIDPDALGALVTAFKSRPESIGTLCTLITEMKELVDPAKVKLILSKSGEAIYFSRAPIPFQRDLDSHEDWLSAYPYRKHVGVYIFERETLLRINQLAVSPLESSEQLEQLRWLDNGYKMFALPVSMTSIGVDTPDDLDKVRKLF